MDSIKSRKDTIKFVSVNGFPNDMGLIPKNNHYFKLVNIAFSKIGIEQTAKKPSLPKRDSHSIDSIKQKY